jgi:CRISPR-associated protein Cas1
VNRGQLDADDFVVREGGAVSLDGDARKAVVVAFQERKREEINHPLLAQAVPLGMVPLVQARLMARAVRESSAGSQPGGLDELPGYMPFLVK